MTTDEAIQRARDAVLHAAGSFNAYMHRQPTVAALDYYGAHGGRD